MHLLLDGPIRRSLFNVKNKWKIAWGENKGDWGDAMARVKDFQEKIAGLRRQREQAQVAAAQAHRATLSNARQASTNINAARAINAKIAKHRNKVRPFI